MKKVLFSLSFLVAGSAAFAQIEKGKWTIGASSNGLFATSKVADANNNTRVTSFNISPDVGYFFIDNFAAGVRANLNTSKMKGSKDGVSSYLVAPFVRYYLMNPTAKRVNIFADIHYGLGSYKYLDFNNFDTDSRSINEFQIQVGPSFWLNEKVALDATLSYTSAGGEDIEKRNNTIGVNFGFRLSLGGTKK